MPKQLPNLEESFLAHAQQILCAEGYAALSVRRLASECSTATGTVYNYFRNKDELVARVMMVSWREALARMEQAVQSAPTFEAGMIGMYQAIAAFVARYQRTWVQYAQAGGSGGVVAGHHQQLREQVAQHLRTLLNRTADEGLIPVAPLLAEMLLAAAVQPDLDEALVQRLTQRLISTKGEKP